MQCSMKKGNVFSKSGERVSLKNSHGENKEEDHHLDHEILASQQQAVCIHAVAFLPSKVREGED